MTTIELVTAIAQQLPEARLSGRYAAQAVFFVGIAYGLIRWIGRTLREVSGSEFKESERERLFLQSLSESTVAQVAEGAEIGPATLPNAGRRDTVNVLVHCPGCGRALTPEPYPLPFVTTCDGCGRRVNVRGDGPGRMAVVAQERVSSNRIIE